MNFFRKSRNQRERLPANVMKKHRKIDSVDTRVGSEADVIPKAGQQFTSLEEARSWALKNGVTALRYYPSYAAENYPEPSLTPEEGKSLIANPMQNPSQLTRSRLQGHAIRLLTLEPGLGLDTISCRLEDASLDSAPSYEALSYAWGDPIPRYHVVCNGATVVIAPSLHRALWEFRELRLYGPFWIDAICVNQADIEEKTQQVKMMRSVYEKAALVRIWLGPASNDTERAVILLSQTYQVLMAKQQNPDPAEAYISLISMGFGDATLEDVFMLGNFYAQWWFDRSWVVQELAVAAKAIFQQGAFEIEAEIVLTVAAEFSKTLSRSLAMEASVPWAKFESLKPFLFPPSVFAGVKQDYDARRKLTLSELIRRTAMLKATVAHDKFFAFAGLASDGDVSMINYATTIRDLHLSIAKNALIFRDKPQSEGLDFLSHVRTYLDTREYVIEEPQKARQLGLDYPLSDQDLPSWAPDLTYYDHFFQNSIVPLSSVFPSDSTKLNTAPDIHLRDGELLAVRGKVLDTTLSFVESFPYRYLARFIPEKAVADKVLEQLTQWPVDCFDLVERHGFFADQSGAVTQATVARTIVFNSAFGDNGTHSSLDWRYFKAYQAWRVVLGLTTKGHRSNLSKQNLYATAAEVVNDGSREAFAKAEAQGEPHMPLTPEITAADVLSYATAFDRLARGRKFGITQSRMIGWFPECTREGDVIVLFNGCRLPHVLRYYEEKEVFKIVGDCALSVFMDDEAFKEVERALEEAKSGFIAIC